MRLLRLGIACILLPVAFVLFALFCLVLAPISLFVAVMDVLWYTLPPDTGRE